MPVFTPKENKGKSHSEWKGTDIYNFLPTSKEDMSNVILGFFFIFYKQENLIVSM